MTLGSLGTSLESFPPRAGVAVAGLLFPGGDRTMCVTCAGRRCSSTAGCAAVQVLVTVRFKPREAKKDKPLCIIRKELGRF